ncbi:oxidative damage protection protein [Blochmannia endosymbiont of Camponotus (Colobopsis) obliquus]|uniref:oxidative damage protection protein n=1 Tax=Blochmannia endosymbiont of Camponotus (Colobopsis) obliquus TaxID=1505597 RepID=UPI00061A6FD7|nr:oxidative damage protection protein [Blochmannia endosymbiont of Camponotus (Colobopsis) obliquus]AKC60412.1 putative Fe(2+)-trafficking protein [Blochmannia endosymbiont of Camponotus (Colobopsis) obliquus]
MKRIIYCVFLQQLAEGLTIQSYPGKLGKYIYQNISQQAWDQWKRHQTILINEKKLNLINNDHRNFLEKEMIKFLFTSEQTSKKNH